MPEKLKSVIIGPDRQRGQDLVEALGNLVEVVAILPDPAGAYIQVKSLGPEAVFISGDGDETEAVNLMRMLSRTLGPLPLFLFAARETPDLVLAGFRAGAADFIQFPADDTRVRKTVEKALERSLGGFRQADIFGLFSPVGGQGITSLAVNLADHLHRITADRVMVLDLNLYLGNINLLLDHTGGYHLPDLIRDMDRLDEHLLFSSLVPHANGFYLLSVPGDINDGEGVTPSDIAGLLAALRPYFSYIVIDLPHDFSEKTLAAIQACDRLILVGRQAMPAVKALQKVLCFFEELEFDIDKIKVLINLHQAGNELTIDDIGYVLKQPVFDKISMDKNAFGRAASQGKTVAETLPRSRANQDLSRLAGQLTGTRRAAMAGGFGRFFNRLLPGTRGGAG